MDQRELLLLELAGYERGDQEPGDYEEDINAEKTARETRNLEVIEDDRDDRDCPKPIDIGAIAQSHVSKACAKRYGGLTRSLPQPASKSFEHGFSPRAAAAIIGRDKG